MAKKTWKELKAEGVHRCVAEFSDGRRCARRAENQERGGFCARHQSLVKNITSQLMGAANDAMAQEPQDEDLE